MARSSPKSTGFWSVAACADADPKLFFPGPGEVSAVIAAKAICATCPVTAQCLEFALASNERFGIWGGLTEQERRPRRRRRTAA